MSNEASTQLETVADGRRAVNRTPSPSVRGDYEQAMTTLRASLHRALEALPPTAGHDIVTISYVEMHVALDALASLQAGIDDKAPWEDYR